MVGWQRLSKCFVDVVIVVHVVVDDRCAGTTAGSSEGSSTYRSGKRWGCDDFFWGDFIEVGVVTEVVFGVGVVVVFVRFRWVTGPVDGEPLTVTGDVVERRGWWQLIAVFTVVG